MRIRSLLCSFLLSTGFFGHDALAKAPEFTDNDLHKVWVESFVGNIDPAKVTHLIANLKRLAARKNVSKPHNSMRNNSRQEDPNAAAHADAAVGADIARYVDGAMKKYVWEGHVTPPAIVDANKVIAELVDAIAGASGVSRIAEDPLVKKTQAATDALSQLASTFILATNKGVLTQLSRKKLSEKQSIAAELERETAQHGERPINYSCEECGHVCSFFNMVSSILWPAQANNKAILKGILLAE